MTPARSEQLGLRAAGVSAIAAGVLRIAEPIVPGLSGVRAAYAYLLNDALFLFGLIGIFVCLRASGGRAARAGLVLAGLGILVVRSQGTISASFYMQGAVLFTVGMAVMGLAGFRQGGAWRIAALAWFAALITGAGSLAGHGVFFEVAAVLFSLGFVLAGWAMIGAGALPADPQEAASEPEPSFSGRRPG